VTYKNKEINPTFCQLPAAQLGTPFPLAGRRPDEFAKWERLLLQRTLDKVGSW